jgi:FkbM family methyltransferase
MVNRARRARRDLRYRHAVGPRIWKFVADDLIGRSRVVTISIDGRQLCVRTNTPDLEVVNDCLVEREYADVRANDVHVIIDAGAHIGAASMHFAATYPDARIIAIEPQRDNYELMVRNTADLHQITPIFGALAETAGERALGDRGTGNWGYTIVASDEADPTGEIVSCVTIAELLDEYDFGAIDILKLDIEGGELAVLADCDGWIDRVEVITLELHDRIARGCSRAFYLATKDFSRFETHGEKVTAYKH